MTNYITEVPDTTCNWPIDLSGCTDWTDEFPEPQIKQRAVNLAVQSLRMLTAGRVGGCPITVRPCGVRCANMHHHGLFNPHINDRGAWVNACRCESASGCSCQSVSRIMLPGPVGRVDEVKVDGQVLNKETDYVVYQGFLLRKDGTWPYCQDLTLPDTEVGTMSVTYLNAYQPDFGAAAAAGVLAAEYAKACMGKKCALPSGVRSITRQGISMDITSDAFEGGKTGIAIVDAWVSTWNPHHLKSAPTVMSPDLVSPARQTSAGWL